MMDKKLLISAVLVLLPLLISGIKNANSQDSQLSDSPLVILQTTQGDIQIRLFPQAAPKTCQNFIGLINQGYYNGVIFHRVIKGFMIQGGDPTGTGRGGESVWGGKFEDEFSADYKFNRPGLLAMANAGPNTNGSQFFITTVETPHLNNKHTIFGEVISGFEAVQAIENVQVIRGDRPVEDQQIFNAVIVNY